MPWERRSRGGLYYTRTVRRDGERRRLYYGAGAAGDATGTSFAYLHVEANEGGSSGGHAAIRLGAQTFHFQFHDGMLEYASPRDLVEQVTGIIRRLRPEVVLAPDPGGEYVRWHKTDHRMAANNTIDAIRAAEWHLYFPNQRLHDGLEPWKVPQEYYYYAGKDSNYNVNIDSEIEKKIAAAAAHVSQFEPSIDKYRPDWAPTDLEKLKARFRARKDASGHYVESFRSAQGFNQQ
jgi:LmbE family N-acetylglucosaminyl deacetylase